MKTPNYFLLAAGMIVAASCTQAPESDQAVTGEVQEVTDAPSNSTLQADAGNSLINWIGTKVSGYHVGTLNFKSGELQMNGMEVAGGSLTIDMTSLAVTGPEGSDAASNEKLKGHLMSPDFFDTENHSEARFEITQLTPFDGAVADENDERQAAISQYKVASPSHTVSGNLTIKGISKNITFPALIEVSENGQVEVTAKFNINRTEWDITFPGKPDDLIRDEIHLGISVKTMAPGI